eukprot:229316-Prymnesium_polylepis.2
MAEPLVAQISAAVPPRPTSAPLERNSVCRSGVPLSPPRPTWRSSLAQQQVGQYICHTIDKRVDTEVAVLVCGRSNADHDAVESARRNCMESRLQHSSHLLERQEPVVVDIERLEHVLGLSSKAGLARVRVAQVLRRPPLSSEHHKQPALVCDVCGTKYADKATGKEYPGGSSHRWPSSEDEQWDDDDRIDADEEGHAERAIERVGLRERAAHDEPMLIQRCDDEA